MTGIVKKFSHKGGDTRTMEEKHDKRIAHNDPTIGGHCIDETLRQIRMFLETHKDGINTALLSAPKGKTKVDVTVSYSIEGPGVHVEAKCKAKIEEQMDGAIISESQMSLPFETADGVKLQLYTDPNRGAGVEGQA